VSGEGTLVLAMLLPLGGAVGIVLLRRRPDFREAVSLLAAVALFLAVAALVPDVAAGARPALDLFQVLPGIGIGFHAEPLGIGFALLVAALWFVTVLYAIGYMRAHEEAHQARFYAFFAIAIATTVGAAFAANLLTLYFFYEALTLATYPLVTHGGTDKDRAGGRTYLRFLLGTSLVFLLIAIAWTWQLAGTLAFTPGGVLGELAEPLPGVSPLAIALLYALFLFGTGKAALMPFHAWLPAAMVAPTPVSALLHAVAVVKLGVFVVLKVTIYIFGIETLAEADGGRVMQYVAAVTLLTGAVLALREDNLKRRLAYSTISQLAYVVLAASLANELSLAAGGLHIAAHAVAKITLFFCAGLILVTLHKTTVSELNGIARVMPVTVTAWIIASCAIIGLPFTGGFWGKWYLAQGAWEAGQPILLAVILVGSLLAAGYLLPPAIRACYAVPTGLAATRSGVAAAEGPRASLIAVCATALASVLLFFAARPLLSFLGGVK